MKKLFSIMLCAVIMLGIMPIAKAEKVQTYDIEPQYADVFGSGFHEGVAIVSENGPHCVVIDKTGKVIFSTQVFDEPRPYSEGLVMIRPSSLSYYYFYDKTGKAVISLEDYDGADSFSESMAKVKKNGKYGFVDKKGKVAIAPQYDDANSFSEGLAAIEKDGQWGFIDKTGKKVIALKYDSALPFSEGLAAVSKNGKYGFIDKTGKEVVALKYDYTNPFSEGLALVKKEEKIEYVHEYAYIDKTGKEVIVMEVDVYAQSFSEGLALVDGKIFIDKTGKEVIALKYDAALPFSEGLAAVEKDGQWGFIDKKGKEVIVPQYDAVYPFSEGLAAVAKDGNWGFIAKTPAVTQAASVTYKNANVTIDGVKQSFSQPAVVSSQGNSFVPMRAIFEKLGSTVKWDQKTNTATAVKGTTTIKLTIGITTATVNGKSVTLTAPAFTLSGNTMVPLRFVAEALGAKVVWNNSTQTVIITSP